MKFFQFDRKGYRSAIDHVLSIQKVPDSGAEQLAWYVCGMQLLQGGRVMVARLGLCKHTGKANPALLLVHR